MDPSGLAVETVLDAASFGLSARDFICDPSWANAGWLALDGLGLMVPFLPAIGLIRRMDDVSDGKRWYRYMSQAEADAVRNTGVLRGGRPGETFWTDAQFTSADRASNRLSLGGPPEVRMEFEILNNPTLARNGTRVRPDYGGAGGGREYMSYDPVMVRIINVQPLGRRGRQWRGL